MNKLVVEEVTIYPFKDNMFEEFFGIDCDYSLNGGCWRKDTTKIGFLDEAQRCSKEYSEAFTKAFNESDDEGCPELLIELYKVILEEMLDSAAHDNSLESQFILGNDSYTEEYKVTIVSDIESVNESPIKIVVSYIQK